MICDIILKMLNTSYADMAKLADALASGANRGNPVQVQVLLSAFFIFQNQAAEALIIWERILFQATDPSKLKAN